MRETLAVLEEKWADFEKCGAPDFPSGASDEAARTDHTLSREAWTANDALSSE